MTEATSIGVSQRGSHRTPPRGEWLPSDTPGFLVRSLHEAPNVATRLMRIEAGGYAGPHTHDLLEHVYVVDGSFYDDAGDHPAGSFIVRQAGELHIAGSRDGATLLLIYTGGAA